MTMESASELPEESSEDLNDPMIGTVVADRFRVDSVLGRGGMGAVYRACQLQLERDVAIKVILHEVAVSSVMVERFRREAAATARLRHPNIVNVYDFGSLDDGRHFLVMELLKGPTLQQWLVENGPQTPARTLEIIRPVARAIAALHRAEIVHRDLKSSNIVLPDSDDADDVVKVVDFGIARLRESQATNLTGAQIIGTPGYIAPELIEGQQADARSDIYALGVIAYTTLAGRPPFHASTTGAILLQQLTKNPEAPSKILGGLTTPLDKVILRAIDKDPARRYQTAEAFLEAFESAVAPESAAATGPISGTHAAARPDVSGARILVIDDDEDLRTILRATLEDGGYSVMTASDGIDALLKLGAETFDLVLSDVDMPNLDGFRLLEQLSAKGVSPPVIFVTGRVGGDDEVRGLELGAEDYIRKPIMPNVLLLRVKAALQKRMR